MLHDNLTLTDAVTIAQQQVESAGEHAKAIMSTQNFSVQTVSVQRHAKVHGRGAGGSKNRTAGAHSTAPFTSHWTVTSATHTCFRCGSDKHLANAVECPAAKVTCKNCKKKGHFARVCRTTQTHTVREVVMPEYTLLLLQDKDVSAKLLCTVQVEAGAIQRPVTLTVDTGTSVSVLPKSIYDDYFENVPLQPPAVCLVTYSRTPINVIGCLHATVVKDCRQCSVNFYVVDKETALMGMDLITALKLCIKGDTILPEPATTSASFSSG